MRKLAPILILASAAVLFGQIAVRQQGFVPYSDAPIHYLNDDLTDPVWKLPKAIERGEETLEYDETYGYLPSVLKKLNVPVSSQTLVFSKTSFQFRKISPATPRATYFNDDIYIGWVQDGKAIEIVSFDPLKGAIFYIVEEKDRSKPGFLRAELDCTQCHVARNTLGVPGVLVRSIHSNQSGAQAFRAPSFDVGHDNAFEQRFGGWYVTGNHGKLRHMGNVTLDKNGKAEDLNREAGANVTDLSKFFDVKPYITTHSDIVAHLVLAHQTQMHNYITALSYKTRTVLHEEAAKLPPNPALQDLSEAGRKKITDAAEGVVRYLLFADESSLGGRVEGSSTYSKEFAALGPFDAQGRSLRQFDLQQRLFKYPCSYLIYTESFDALPELSKALVYQRLFEVLTGEDKSDGFSKLSGKDRQAILEILVATKPGLPQAWVSYGDQWKTKGNNRSIRRQASVDANTSAARRGE